MGNECVPTKNNKKQMTSSKGTFQSSQIKPYPPAPSFGLSLQTQTHILHFKHAPLSNSQFLYHKFHSDSASPVEINLLCQIVDVKKDKNSLKIGIINTNQVNVFVVSGGKAIKNQTGLYLSICKYTFCEQRKITKPSDDKELGDILQVKIPFSKNSQLKVIVDSRSKPDQSMFLINSYSAHEQSLVLESQQMQWNSLGFELGNIYGQDQQKVNGNNKDTCVICQTQEVVCIFDPCRHMCVCKQCMRKYRKTYKICPLCKHPYQKIIAYNQLN